jgi:hypothetical protein
MSSLGTLYNTGQVAPGLISLRFRVRVHVDVCGVTTIESPPHEGDLVIVLEEDLIRVSSIVTYDARAFVPAFGVTDEIQAPTLPSQSPRKVSVPRSHRALGISVKPKAADSLEIPSRFTEYSSPARQLTVYEVSVVTLVTVVPLSTDVLSEVELV